MRFPSSLVVFVMVLLGGATVFACSSSSSSGSSGTGSACTSAGGTCVLGGTFCAKEGASSAQDCETNPPNPGGAYCCLQLTDGGVSSEAGAGDGAIK
jgi:hypothetical protein